MQGADDHLNNILTGTIRLFTPLTLGKCLKKRERRLLAPA